MHMLGSVLSSRPMNTCLHFAKQGFNMMIALDHVLLVLSRFDDALCIPAASLFINVFDQSPDRPAQAISNVRCICIPMHALVTHDEMDATRLLCSSKPSSRTYTLKVSVTS